MSKILIFLLILVLAFFQTSFLPLNFLFSLVCFLAISEASWEIFLWAFLAGVFLDFLTSSPLGFSSLAFLAVAGGFSVYKKKFSFKSPITIFILVFVANFLFSFLSRTAFLLKEALFWSTLFTLLRIFFPFFFESFGVKDNKIKV